MEQTDPCRRRTSARLAFADHVDYLIAGQRAPGSPKERKPWLALIRRLMARWSCSKTLLRYGTGRCWQPEHTRRGMVLLTQRFGQEALCCGRVLLGREEKVDGRAGRIHRTIQISATCP